MDRETLCKPLQHRLNHAWIYIPGLFNGINPPSVEGSSSWVSPWRSKETWQWPQKDICCTLARHRGRDDPRRLSWHSACCGDSYKQLQLFKASKKTALIKYYTEQEERRVGGARKGLTQKQQWNLLHIRTQAEETELLSGELGEHCWYTSSSQKAKTTASHTTQGHWYLKYSRALCEWAHNTASWETAKCQCQTALTGKSFIWTVLTMSHSETILRAVFVISMLSTFHSSPLAHLDYSWSNCSVGTAALWRWITCSLHLLPNDQEERREQASGSIKGLVMGWKRGCLQERTGKAPWEHPFR